MKTWQFVLCVPLVAAGCAGQQRMSVARSGTMTTERLSGRPVVTRTVTRTVTDITPGRIHVSPEIAKVCDLPEAHFEFDSVEIGGDAAAALDKLATCFTTGKLAGHSMKIVGHADARGTEEYNMGLGQRRAGAVADYLAKRGLAEGRMQTSSLGELEAKGNDEAGWAKDRRVEILLGDEAVLLPTDAPKTDTSQGGET